MKDALKKALAIAAEKIADEAEYEEDSDVQTALGAVTDMLLHLSNSASSPLFANLKAEISQSGGDGRKRELDDITVTVAAFFLMREPGQNRAADLAVKLCGHSSTPTVKRALAGADDAESLKRLERWPEIERRLTKAEESATYRAWLNPEWAASVPPDCRSLEVLLTRASDLNRMTAQHSV